MQIDTDTLAMLLYDHSGSQGVKDLAKDIAKVCKTINYNFNDCDFLRKVMGTYISDEDASVADDVARQIKREQTEPDAPESDDTIESSKTDLF